MTDLKKLISLLLMVTIGASINTQAQNPDNIRVSKKFVRLYNQKKYNKIHAMFSKDFKRSMDEESLEYFLADVIRDRQGKIRSLTYLRKDRSFHVYLITFDQGELQFNLAVDAEKHISGLAFLPPSKPAANYYSPEHPMPKNNPLRHEVDLLCDSLVSQFAEKNNLVGLSIGIIKNGTQYTYGYGKTNKQKNIIPDEHTIFDLGSVSKTFTGLLLSIAIEQQLVKPNDDIRKYLKGSYPNLEYDKTPVTFLHLISHTSALPRVPYDLESQPDYNESDPYKNYSKAMLMANLHTVKLSHKPGTVNEYSNYALALCGMILEDVFQKSYAELVAKYITIPLEMNSTFVTIPDSLEPRMVGCYDEVCNPVQDWHLGDMAPAGGISSTVHDMLQYLRANISENTPAIKRAHIPIHKESSKQAIAYSWVISELNNGHHLIWHNGATFGSSSFCGYIAETGTAIVILNNSGTLVDDLAISLLKTLR